MKNYYHFYSDGKLSPELFRTKADFVAAMNRLAVCAARFPGVVVVAFTFENTHVHFLLFCREEEGKAFTDWFKRLTMIYISRSRGGKPDDLKIHFESDVIPDDTILKKKAAYVIIQPTKDGKKIMPHDYPWSSAPLYFRGDKAILPWYVDKMGSVQEPIHLSDLSWRMKRKLFKSAVHLPDEWLFCNGMILPANFVDVSRFEAIFGSHNAFRAFQSKSGDDDMIRLTGTTKGVSLPDGEMRAACRTACHKVYNVSGVRELNSVQRLEIARFLRRKYLISKKQLSRIVRVPLDEIERLF